jgi:hypothetical protein
MKAIIIQDKDAKALLDKLKLENFETREPDKELVNRIHRKFHYIVSSWLSEQGAEII